MADISATQPSVRPARRRFVPFVVGVGLSCICAAATFYTTWSGLLVLPSLGGQFARSNQLPDIAFIPLDPIMISLPPASRSRHLRFTAQVEVTGHFRAEVELLKPRIVDLMNSYLRAVDPSELTAQGALIRLRSQMLRRIQMITGEGRVRDLLISEFVLD